MTQPQRIQAFEEAMLNTIVRTVRAAFSNLTLQNCLESIDFRAIARVALQGDLFTTPYEPASVEARLNLIDRIESYSPW